MLSEGFDERLAHLNLPTAVEQQATPRVVDATTRGIDDLDLIPWLGFTTGACISRVFLQYPFLLAMTRRQACAKISDTPSSTLLRQYWREHGGAKAWFRGFPAMAAGMALSETIYMWFFEAMRSKNSSPIAAVMPSASQAFLDGSAGFAADFTTTAIQVPFVVIANRQIAAGVVGDGKKIMYESARGTIMNVWRTAGARGVFAGLGASLLLTPSSALWWAGYGEFKAWAYPAAKPAIEAVALRAPWLPQPLISTSDNMILNVAAAVVCGAVVAVLWNPAMVVRTRVQLGSSAVTPRMRDVVRTIYREEGWRGFVQGTCMNMSATTVDVTAFAILYELGKQFAEKTL